ncbi:MAG: hypothetical protein H6702_15350 [Myxococcales bacterium]|nr:hypothetical protein [Myxococcales bacterium]
MVLLGTLGCALIVGALAWFMPVSQIGCDRHLDCPPHAGRCFVGPAVPQGHCGERCKVDADCPQGCCRPSALDGKAVCAPVDACG